MAVTDGGEDLLLLLQRAARLRGAEPFFCVGGEAISAHGLLVRVESAARALLARGFAPGDRLAIHLHRCIDEVVALLAAAVAGGIAVPIHPKLKDAQVAHVLADCAPWAVVTSATKGALLADQRGLLSGRRVFSVGAHPADPSWEPFDAVAETSERALRPAPEAPAILLYTSGSTGLQKGVIQSQQNLVRGARIVASYLGLTANDHVLALLPFSFDYGLNQLLSSLHAGCRITAADYLGLGELASLLRTVRPTGLAGVPSLWHECARGLSSTAIADSDGSQLRYITNSGGRLGIDDLRVVRSHWPHVQVFAMYGLTEAFRSAFLDPRRIDDRPDSFGKALPGVELLLVDPSTGSVIEGSGEGELVHAGALVALGYWNRPDVTAQRFRPDPRGIAGTVVYSGDIVRRDDEGLLYFVARNDRMLKAQGHRISPDEVAAAIAGCTGVGEVAVFGEDAGALGHRIVVAVSGDPTDQELPQRIMRQCRARLPAYMLPSRVHVMLRLPHTQNGKIDYPTLVRDLACTDEN